MPGISNINRTNFAKAFNRGYVYGRASASNVSSADAKWYEAALIKFKECQGETFNNLVTAVGTAGVAPIFIIHNPLAKEDKQTKEYTAARQPISAIITLGAQVPIMDAYNKALEYAATRYHFDKCDLSAAPPQSYLKNGIKHLYKDYIYQCAINGIEPEKKKAKMKEFYYQLKDEAFYRELKNLRESARNGNVPEYLAKSMTADGHIKIEDMISPKDLKDAERQLLEHYFKEVFGLDVADLGLGEKKKVDSLDALKKKAVKQAFKEKNIDIDKNLIKTIKTFINENVDEVARMNVEEHLRRQAKVKVYSSNLYRKAKEELAEYQRKLIVEKVPNNEFQRLMKIKNDELFEGLRKHAEQLRETAPKSVPEGSLILDAAEADTLYNKINTKLTMGSADDKLIRHLRTSEGSTFDELLKSVQIKKWLTTRINKSEKYLSKKKKKSGLVVGLAILPFTCGLLNWAYPRIMEEWFPNLAHAKSASSEKKEAK